MCSSDLSHSAWHDGWPTKSKPVALRSAEPSAAHEAAIRIAEAPITMIADGWVEAANPQGGGGVYYANQQTGQTSWEKPTKPAPTREECEDKVKDRSSKQQDAEQQSADANRHAGTGQSEAHAAAQKALGERLWAMLRRMLRPAFASWSSCSWGTLSARGSSATSQLSCGSLWRD